MKKKTKIILPGILTAVSSAIVYPMPIQTTSANNPELTGPLNTDASKDTITMSEKQEELYNKIKMELLPDIRDAFFNILSGVIDLIGKYLEDLKKYKNYVEQHEPTTSGQRDNDDMMKFLIDINDKILIVVKEALSEDDDGEEWSKEDEDELCQIMLKVEYLIFYSLYKEIK